MGARTRGTPRPAWWTSWGGARPTAPWTPAVPPAPRPGKGGTSRRGPGAQAWKAAGSRACWGAAAPGRAGEPNRRGLVGQRAQGPLQGGKAPSALLTSAWRC